MTTTTEPTYVYTYATNRPDFPYAVGAFYPDGPANGAVALVGSARDAMVIRDALSEHYRAAPLDAHPDAVAAALAQGYTGPPARR